MPNFISSPIISSPITSVIINQNRNNHTTKPLSGSNTYNFSTPELMLEYPNNSTKPIDPIANG
uniref:Putative ovule protein n=1 Tax=Solanum chacoense TaxID=4108 RepID=A0A0V0GGZ6_SOLCH